MRSDVDPLVEDPFRIADLDRQVMRCVLAPFIAQNINRRMDLDVEYERGKKVLRFRVVVLTGRES